MNENWDVLIIGSGIAGLTCGLKLAEKGIKTAIITRAEKPDHCNSAWAQGGIVFPRPLDEEKLVQDILSASTQTSDLDVSQIIASSHDILQEVLIDKAKVPFERDDQGKLSFTMEAAHSSARILYDGDHTGRSIQIALLNYIDRANLDNLKIFTSMTALDLITPGHHGVDLKQRYEEHRILGAYVFDQKKKIVHKVLSKKVILATGGIGNIYLHNSNTHSSRGDGHAMAKRAGARLINMEFIQFHPTTLFIKKSHRRFLISEALRGEGGILLDTKGRAFMKDYHPDAELASRDIVSQSIWEEMVSKKQDHVYLDMSHMDGEHLKVRFPTIYQTCLDHGVDMTKEPIPVVPAAHYTCGGIQTDHWGKTLLNNLYAIGEVACTGLHGANRLASTSLLEGLVFGHRCAQKVAGEISNSKVYSPEKIRDWSSSKEEVDLALVGQDWFSLKQTMWNYVGIKRTSNRLSRARAIFGQMGEQIQDFYHNTQLHDELIGLRNAVEIAHMVVSASIRNKKSIGCFYRD